MGKHLNDIDINTKSLDVNTNNKEVFSNETNLSASNRVATFGTKIWPGGVVPYFIQSHFNVEEVNNIQTAIDYIRKNTCLRFERIWNTNRKNKMIISLWNQGNCYGEVHPDGYGGVFSQVFLTRNTDCTKPRMIIHEIMHTIGFSHEHQRPDRDYYIWINYNNAQPNAYQNLNLEYKDIYGYAYDCGSVMQYHRKSFTARGGDVIVPKNSNCYIPKDGNEWNNHNPWMSQRDIHAVQSQYCNNG